MQWAFKIVDFIFHGQKYLFLSNLFHLKFFTIAVGRWISLESLGGKGITWRVLNENCVKCWAEFSEHQYSHVEQGQRHPRWYLKDSFSFSMMVFKEGGDDSDDTPTFSHRHPLHIARCFDSFLCYLLPTCHLAHEFTHKLLYPLGSWTWTRAG